MDILMLDNEEENDIIVKNLEKKEIKFIKHESTINFEEKVQVVTND